MSFAVLVTISISRLGIDKGGGDETEAESEEGAERRAVEGAAGLVRGGLGRCDCKEDCMIISMGLWTYVWRRTGERMGLCGEIGLRTRQDWDRGNPLEIFGHAWTS